MSMSIDEQVSNLENYITELDDEIMELYSSNRDSLHLITLRDVAYNSLKRAISKSKLKKYFSHEIKRIEKEKVDDNNAE